MSGVVILTQTWNRRAVSEYCLRQLGAVVPEGAVVQVWDDGSTEYDAREWVPDAKGVTQLRRLMKAGGQEPENLGIDRLRAVQLEWVSWPEQMERFEWVYLTDTDALHDPGWWPVAMKLARVGLDRGVGHLPVCLYNSGYHAGPEPEEVHEFEGVKYVMRPTGPGVSMLLHRTHLEKLARLGVLKRSWKDWDWTLIDRLGSQVVTAWESQVEHLGAGGLHSEAGDWEQDRAVRPTAWLVKEREKVIRERGKGGKLQSSNFKIQGSKSKGQGVGRRTVLEELEVRRPEVVVINQPRGLGDIVFLKRAVEAMVERVPGVRVVWAVDGEMVSLNRHIRYGEPVMLVPRCCLAYERMDEAREVQWLDGNRVAVLPLRWCDSIMKVPYEQCMRAKYDWLGLDWREWTKGYWKWPTSVQERALREALGLTEVVKRKEPYGVVCRKFRSDGSGTVADIPDVPGMVNVEYGPLPGFTALDWLPILKGAAGIHSVGTSLQYVAEMSGTQAKVLKLWPRVPDEVDCRNYRGLFELGWEEVGIGNH